MVRSWTEIENNIVSVERVREYLRTPKEVANQLLTLLAEVKISANKTHNFSVPPGQTPSLKVMFPLKNCSICFLSNWLDLFYNLWSSLFP